MVKRAIIISAILIVIIIIVTIIVSVVNSKPTKFISIVSYDSGIPVMKEAVTTNTTAVDNEELFIETLLEHEKTVMFTSVIVVVIFTILFYGAKRSKS